MAQEGFNITLIDRGSKVIFGTSFYLWRFNIILFDRFASSNHPVFTENARIVLA
jgi:hypothetical protein